MAKVYIRQRPRLILLEVYLCESKDCQLPNQVHEALCIVKSLLTLVKGIQYEQPCVMHAGSPFT